MYRCTPFARSLAGMARSHDVRFRKRFGREYDDGCPKQGADSAGQRSIARGGIPTPTPTVLLVAGLTSGHGCKVSGADAREPRTARALAGQGYVRYVAPEARLRGRRRQLSGPTLESCDLTRPNLLSQEAPPAKQLSVAFPLRRPSVEPPTNYVFPPSKLDA